MIRTYEKSVADTKVVDTGANFMVVMRRLK